jgi:hypothetical protein
MIEFACQSNICYVAADSAQEAVEGVMAKYDGKQFAKAQRAYVMNVAQDRKPEILADDEIRAQGQRWESEWEARVAAEEIAEANRIEAEENERTEREDSYALEF